MSMVRSFVGVVIVEIVSADLAGILDFICQNQILLWDIDYCDQLTIRVRVYRTAWGKLKKLIQKRGATCRVVAREGLYWNFRAMLMRPVQILGLVFFLVAVFYFPGRVFFAQVEGNSVVCGNEILEAAANLGVRFGASRRYVRSEAVKNGLLSSIEELEWAGVNTKGCIAIISVRERSPQSMDISIPGAGDVVALCDGVILSCDVIRGSSVCIPGQAVKAGQILISGTVDHGIAVTSTAAKGEVFAATNRRIAVRTFGKTQIRGAEQGQTVKYRLLIGKKLINFFKGSGISGGTCVKMYSKYVLTLPGGFKLPFALVRETLIYRDLSEKMLHEYSARKILSEFASSYTRDHMIAGQIVAAEEKLTFGDGVYQLAGDYACTEMIGRVQQEQIGAYNGKTN